MFDSGTVGKGWFRSLKLQAVPRVGESITIGDVTFIVDVVIHDIDLGNVSLRVHKD